MTNTNTARDWFTTGVLAALAWVFAWSGGIIVTLGRNLYAPYIALETQLAPLDAQLEASNAFITTLDSVVTRVAARRDSIGRLVPESVFARRARGVYDSLANTLATGRRAALRDSIDIATLQILPLPASDTYLILSAQEMLGAEMQHWRQLEILSRARLRGAETIEQRQVAEAAMERHGIHISSFASAFDRAVGASHRRSSDVSYLRRQRDNALADARRLFGLATMSFPLSIIGLVVLYRRTIGRRWHFPIGTPPPAA